MNEEREKNRAWIEIDLHNLEHNVRQIQKIIPKETKIIGIVKANAYGHGAISISRKLNEMGIDHLAVATLEEGIELRKAGITGEILILGYTSPACIDYVVEYNLTQTIVDEDYANCLQERLHTKLKAQVKVNTGMNRNGIWYADKEAFARVFGLSHLEITGTFSHLCVSDSEKEEDKEFTKQQIERYFAALKAIEENGNTPGETHIQASYGILNEPEVQCSYVRPGIILYGVYSQEKERVETKIDLKPVLSLKARVMGVRTIEKGESVSYGRTFIAQEESKIATVGIGYADGFPRSLSGKNRTVIVNGGKGTIIGRICMDQLMIIVPKETVIQAGDIVTLIGQEPEVRIEKVATDAGTITNEILSSLGRRLPILEKKK